MSEKSLRIQSIIWGVRGTHYPTLLHTSYAGNLKFIKNNSLNDSSN